MSVEHNGIGTRAEGGKAVPPLKAADFKPVLAGAALLALNALLYAVRGEQGFYLFYALSALLFAVLLFFTAKGHSLTMFLRVFVMVWATYSLVIVIMYLALGIDMRGIMRDAALLGGMPRLLTYFAAIPFCVQFTILLALRRAGKVVLASPGLIFCTAGLAYVFVFGFVVLNMYAYS